MSVTISEIQAAIWAHKLVKGFNTTSVELEFCLLTEELGEAIKAWRRDPAELPGELADVFIYVASLAQMHGIDLGQAVVDKMAVNAGREYVRDDVTGHWVKVEAAAR